MIVSTILGLPYLIYPEKTILFVNFGELCIFTFFWAFILFLIILIDKRLNLIK